MKSNTPKLEPDTFYHVYNRGINGETIFKQERNYAYFLGKYAHYIEPVAKTYAYCLLKNHFHLLIQTRSESEILDNFKSPVSAIGDNPIVNSSAKNKTASFHISNQFAKLFNGYCQAINKACNRTGGLFEEPFLRIHVESEDYFTRLVWYIHHNPQKHHFVSDFRNYSHSSYHSFLIDKPTKLQRTYVLQWFGNAAEYQKFHQLQIDEKEIEQLIIEL
jgi:putative transposase